KGSRRHAVPVHAANEPAPTNGLWRIERRKLQISDRSRPAATKHSPAAESPVAHILHGGCPCSTEGGRERFATGSVLRSLAVRATSSARRSAMRKAGDAEHGNSDRGAFAPTGCERHSGECAGRRCG